MSELPSGWTETTLGDVANWGSGGTPSRSEPGFYGGTIPWIKSGELNRSYVMTAEEHITEAALKGSSAKLFPAGSVAIAMYGATIGKTAILGIDAATNQACAVGAPIEGLIGKELLYRLLQNEKNAFIEKGKGGAQPNISQAVIKTHVIGLPPLAEQARIVQKLDELLGQVDTLKARIDAIPTLLKRFRQSVLATAFSGQLTDEWRTQQQSIQPEWSTSHIGEISFVTKLAGFEYTKFVKYRLGGDLKVIKAENAGKQGFKYTDFSTIRSQEVASLTRSRLIGGELLMVFVGAGTGQVAVVPKGDNWFLGPNIAMIKPNNELVISKYMELYCRSPQGWAETLSFQKSTAQPSLSMKTIRQIKLPLPSIDEQTEIVRRVEQLFAFADNLEAKVAAAKSRIDNLTQSILAKAFRGELVPQDPNDEPASVLLERIKAQRAAAPKAKRSRKTSA